MTTIQLTQAPIVKTQMLIRAAAHEVFEAFADPAITANFWFTKSSGRLETESEVTWEWEMYHVSATVRVKEIEQDKRLLIEWNDDDPTTVEWRFLPQKDGTTFVTITETGFAGTGDQMVEQAMGSMGGFSFVLAGAKAFLEHGIALGLTADHTPPELAA